LENKEQGLPTKLRETLGQGANKNSVEACVTIYWALKKEKRA
jgi:hypothetical protein